MSWKSETVCNAQTTVIIHVSGVTHTGIWDEHQPLAHSGLGWGRAEFLQMGKLHQTRNIMKK